MHRPTHTSWRQAVTITVLLSSLLSFHAIFLRHQSVMLLMGPLIWYCAIATFVIASYDADAVQSYCNRGACDPEIIDVNGTPVYLNPLTPGNLSPAPGLDYVCVIFWGIAGLLLNKRGLIISEEIKEAELKLSLYQDMQQQAGGELTSASEAVPTQQPEQLQSA